MTSQDKMLTTYSRASHDRYQRNLAKAAQGLRDLADRIEREGAVEPGEGHDRIYVQRAGDVLHAITWGIANLGADTLLSAASDADFARREEQQASRPS